MIRKVNTILLLLALFLLLYGRDFAHIFYDAKPTALVGQARQELIHSYWNLRFGFWALIIAIAFYIAKINLTMFQIALVNIGLSFGIWSAFDKIILNEYGKSELDGIIIFTIIMVEIYKYKKNETN